MWKGQEKKTGYLPNIGDKTKDLRLNQFSSGKLIGCFFNGFACQSWRLPTCLLCFFFPKVIPKNLGSFHIQKQERVTNMTLFFFLGGGMEWKPQNHNTVYVAVFFVFLRGFRMCLPNLVLTEKVPRQNFGNIAGPTRTSLAAKCFPITGYQLSNICWGFKNWHPLGFKVLVFWRPGVGLLPWLLLRRPRTWEHELIWKVSPSFFFCKSGGSYIAQINWFMNNISEASTHQF